MQGMVGMLLANGHTKKSLEGLGSLKGAPCVLSNLEEILDSDKKIIGNRVTFTWTSNDGSVDTASFDVMNGKDGTGTDSIEDISQDDINSICVVPS